MTSKSWRVIQASGFAAYVVVSVVFIDQLLAALMEHRISLDFVGVALLLGGMSSFVASWFFEQFLVTKVKTSEITRYKPNERIFLPPQ